MTLTSLLEIQPQCLTDLDERSLCAAEELWRRAGSPKEPAKLCEAIETILNELVNMGLGYPKILLRRKKELERGDWGPRQAPAGISRMQKVFQSQPSEFMSLPQADKSEEEVIAEAKQIYTPEQFERWMKMHEYGKTACAAKSRPTNSAL